MTPPSPASGSPSHPTVELLYFATAIAFFFWLLYYYLTTAGGPTLLAFTVVPITFVLFTLDALRKDELYPSLGPIPNYCIAAVYCAISIIVSIYMFVEFEALGTVRAGIWDPMDLWLGGLMALLVMEYARKRYFVLFVLNIVFILYAVYGRVVPGIFNHPGLSWKRIVTSSSLEDTTGIFSGAAAARPDTHRVVRAGTGRAARLRLHRLDPARRIAHRDAFSLRPSPGRGGGLHGGRRGQRQRSRQRRDHRVGHDSRPDQCGNDSRGRGVGGDRGVAGRTAHAANHGDLGLPHGGLPRPQLLRRGRTRLCAGAGLLPCGGAGVYLMSARQRGLRITAAVDPMDWQDWTRIGAFLGVVVGLIGLMSVLHLAPIFAALYVFAAIGAALLLLEVVTAFNSHGVAGARSVGSTLWRFVDTFASMTAELTLLLATLSILTGAFVNTGVPPKVGFILVEAASINLLAMVVVAFLFGALLGMGLPPAPTYILTALVIAPQMIKVGVDPWPVHFFAFFLAVWGELTPPTSVVAAVTSKIARASFIGTLVRAIGLCSSLFVLMAAVFVRPEIVLEPGLAQLAATALVLAATVGVTFSLQARFSSNLVVDVAARVVLAGFALVALAHPDPWIATAACIPVAGFAAYWLLRRRQEA